MGDLNQAMQYDGVRIDINFHVTRPNFGDLLAICGKAHAGFPATVGFVFESLADLQFTQVDDYFGVRSQSDDGDDVVVWLYPLVAGEPVHHHPGPFDGLRLAFNVLRNPARKVDHFMQCVARIAALGESVSYRDREQALDKNACLAMLRKDIDVITASWLSKGIVVGSAAARHASAVVCR